MNKKWWISENFDQNTKQTFFLEYHKILKNRNKIEKKNSVLKSSFSLFSRQKLSFQQIIIGICSKKKRKNRKYKRIKLHWRTKNDVKKENICKIWNYIKKQRTKHTIISVNSITQLNSPNINSHTHKIGNKKKLRILWVFYFIC